MEILDFLKEYWVLITFFVGEIGVVLGGVHLITKGLKCSLRNDILDIYDRCKVRKAITRYQKQSIKYSYDVYKKLRGNSFVDDIVKEIKEFREID